jgi:hypothetical protein
MPTKAKFAANPHAAGIYRAIALRFYLRYVESRHSAEFRGGDLPNHGPLPSEYDADQLYEATVTEWLGEAPDSADAALALVHFAAVLAVDNLIGEVIQQPSSGERESYHAARALADAAGWINKLARSEFAEQARAGEKDARS